MFFEGERENVVEVEMWNKEDTYSTSRSSGRIGVEEENSHHLESLQQCPWRKGKDKEETGWIGHFGVEGPGVAGSTVDGFQNLRSQQ